MRSAPRVSPTVLLGILGLALTACASGPAGQSPQAAAVPAPSLQMGRLWLTVTDYGGAPLERARVDVVSLTQDHFRATAFTDGFGMVRLDGLPEAVRLEVYHRGGSAQQEILVPRQGISQFRWPVYTAGW